MINKRRSQLARFATTLLAANAIFATAASGQSSDAQVGSQPVLPPPVFPQSMLSQPVPSQPVLPQNDHWAAYLLLIIGVGFILPAAILGPYLRRRTAGGMPELHAAQEYDSHTAAQHEPGHDAPPSPGEA